MKIKVNTKLILDNQKQIELIEIFYTLIKIGAFKTAHTLIRNLSNIKDPQIQFVFADLYISQWSN